MANRYPLILNAAAGQLQELPTGDSLDLGGESILGVKLGSQGVPSISFTGDTDTGLFSPGANQVAISTNGTGRLFVDANGNVGVGTGPTNIAGFKRIDLGEAGVSGGLLTLRSSGGAQEANISCSATGLGFTTNSYATPFDARASEIIFGTGSSGTERMRITSAGLVGLGTSSPGGQLTVYSAGNQIRVESPTASNADILFRENNTTKWTAGYVPFISAFRFSNGSTDVLTFTNAGNVGIGTASPGALLDVSAGIRVNSAGSVTSGFSNGVNLGGYDAIGYDANDLVLGGYRASQFTALRFYTAGTERARIDSSGNVGIGTSTVYNAKFHVSAAYTLATGAQIALIENSTTGEPACLGFAAISDNASGGNQGAIYFDAGDTGTTADNKLQFTAAHQSTITPQATLTGEGNVGIGTTSPLTKLDVRSGVITAGTLESTNGAEVLRGYYSGGGALMVLGTEYSSGGPLLGSCVKPSTSAQGAFLSSTGIAGASRGAYVISGNQHKWYIGAAQTVAENISVTMSEAMRLNSGGLLGLGITDPVEKLVVGGATANIGLYNTTPGSTASPSFSRVNFYGYLQTSIWNVASISCGNSASNHYGGILQFATNTTGGTHTTALTIDSSQRVGIGTASPGANLHVNNISALSSVPAIGSPGGLFNATVGASGYGLISGALNTGAYFFQAQTTDGTSATYPISLNPNGGNVGIGTSSPNYELHINASDSTNFIQLTNSGTGTGASDGFLIYNNGVNATVSNQEAGYLSLETSGQARLHILSDGKVGIGTTSPNNKLEITGTTANVGLDGTSNTYINFLKSAANIGYAGDANWMFGGSSSDFGLRATSNLVFGIGANEAARIDGSRRLLVGTSTSINDSGFGTGRLQVTTDGLFQNVVFSAHNSVAINGSALTLARSRGSLASPTFLSAGDLIGRYQFSVWAGTEYRPAAILEAEADLAHASSDLPSRLVFSTTADGAASPTERMRISSNGNVGIGTTAPLTKLEVRSGVITAGSIDAPNGAEVLRGYYSGGGALMVLGTEYSSGGTVIGYAVKPSTSASDAFLSSASGALSRGAYTIAGNIHKWYIGASQTVAENSSVSTSEVMRIDSSGRLLVGTSTPTIRLEENGAGSKRLEISIDSSALARIDATQSSSQLLFGTVGTERLRIDSSGRLLVGRSATEVGLGGSDLLQVAGAINLVSSTNIYSRLLPTSSGLEIIANAYPANLGTTQSIIFKSGTSGGGGPSEIARFTSDGRLLVGTSSARSNFFNSSNSARFQIEGSGSNDNYALSIVSNFAGGTNGAQVLLAKSGGSSVGDNTLVSNGNIIGMISFQGADGTEFVPAASIKGEVDGTPGANDMPGRLLFSTTADGADGPTERMRIASNGTTKISHSSAADVLIVEATNASFANACLLMNTSRAAGTSGIYLYGTANAVQTFITFNNGNVQNTNNSYAGISDIRLKENIVDANSQWDDIKSLQVRKYNFKKETGQQTHTQIGLVAQEVELVSPGLVSETSDRDEDGNVLGTVTKSVNYSVLYMKAVKALQEAMERIETLESSNADILARLSALETA